MKVNGWIENRFQTSVRAAGLWRARQTSRSGQVFGTLHPHQFRAWGITRLLRLGWSVKDVAAFTQLREETIMHYYWLINEEQTRASIMQRDISTLPEEDID